MSLPYTKGTAYSTPTTVRAWVEYPFRNEGDSTAKVYHHIMQVSAEDYTTLADDVVLTDAGAKPARSPFADDSSAYYAGDYNLSHIGDGMVKFDRQFAHVPADRQVPNGPYAVTFPAMYNGDFRETLAGTDTLAFNSTKGAWELSVEVNASRIYIAGAGTSSVNTTTWLVTTGSGINSRIAYDNNGGTGVDGNNRIYWTGSAWEIKTSGLVRYSSTEDVGSPILVKKWTVEASGTSPPPPKLISDDLIGAAGKEIIVDSINYKIVTNLATTLTERARFVIDELEFKTNGKVAYKALSFALNSFYAPTLTTTRTTDVLIVADRDNPTTVNTNSWRKYKYVKTSDVNLIRSAPAEVLVPYAYGGGDYKVVDVYGASTTPDYTMYRGIAAAGDLILAENSTVRQWKNNIYEIESILVQPL